MTKYIERELAIDVIEDTDWYHIGPTGNLVLGANGTTDIPLYKAEDIYKALRSIPDANVEPVVDAEWIDEWKGRYANPRYICSACKITALSDYRIYFLTAHCPHCGAHMKNGV